MTEERTGYTTQDVKTLTTPQLVEEALQSGYDAGYYAKDLFRALEWDIARDRRNATFAELKRKLAAAERLAELGQHLLDEAADYGRGWTVEEFLENEPLVKQFCEALAAWAGGQEEEK